ncbi:hypothetical protein VCHC17A1_3989, partial [Vibrio cholerae HC-17A1]
MKSVGYQFCYAHYTISPLTTYTLTYTYIWDSVVFY